MKLFVRDSYPEINFGRNELLDGSISLSPLYAAQEIDLHVRISTILHHNFVWRQFGHVKFTIFRVACDTLLLSYFK